MASDTILEYENFSTYLRMYKVVPKYDSTNEEKVPHEWWNLDHARIQQILNNMSKSSTGAMAGMAEDDVEIRHLFKAGDSLDKIQRSKTFKVALSGPQAAGKSSFLNSLLDCPGMCYTAADGRACTNSIVVYCYYRGTSEDAFLAEVKFHTAQKIQEIIDQHSRDYYHFYHFDDEMAEMTDESGRQKKTPTHDEADVRAKDTAQDIFETLFGGKDLFREAWTPEGYLSKSFQKECERKCAEAMSKLNTNTERIARYVAPTPEELTTQIKMFLTKVPDAISLWPLVDTIRYGLDREILKQGFEFIDLPGWGDRNIMKTRHADEVRDTVDLEMIFIDTSRITTENVAINNIRAALKNLGPNGVVVVATKIDAISEDELAQCKGEVFDDINYRLQWASEKMTQAADDCDDDEERDLSRYREYLRRQRKCFKVIERCANINAEFEGKFEDLVGTETVKIFHVSAAEYLKWTCRDRIPFSMQPELSPNLTGILEIRKYLHHLPTPYNLRDMREQVHVTINSYNDKIDRVVNQRDRSEGFKTLAAEFVELRNVFVMRMEQGIKDLFDKSFKILTEVNTPSNVVYRQNIDDLINKMWLSPYPYATYNKILKEKGLVLKGASSAKSLADGCDWNRDLSFELEEHLKVWKYGQNQANATLKSAAVTFFRLFFDNVLIGMEHSNSDVCAIATARSKWIPYKNKMLALIDVLLKDLAELQTWLFRRGTMADGRQNSLVPTLTDRLFDEAYNALPALRPSSTPTKKIYVEGKFSFQKKTMQRLFLCPDNHIFDMAIQSFHRAALKCFGTVIETHITSLNKTLDGFHHTLEEFIPIEYEITPQGERIRNSLREMLETLREQALEAQQLVSSVSRVVDDGPGMPVTVIDLNTYERDLSFFIEKASASKPPVQAKPAVLKKHNKKEEVKIKKEVQEEESVFFPDNFTTSKKRQLG